LEWAEKFRWLEKGVSAKSMSGRRHFSTKDAPYQRTILEGLTDKSVQLTILVGASQTLGKTEIMNNLLGYAMHWKPQSSVVMYPTIEAAEKYSKKKFMGLVNATPELSALLKSSKSRDSGNTILVKDFTGGSVYFVGANSPSGLRGASGSLVIGDEIDAMDDGAEGDPIELLFKRVEQFPEAIKLLLSTPTVKGKSRIWKYYEESDQQKFFVPCPKCGRFHTLEWENVKFDEEHTEDAYLLCPNPDCQAHLTDQDRVNMLPLGEWRATKPFKGTRGYHLNGIYTPWKCHRGYKNRLHEMVDVFLKAKKKGSAALKVWVNTFLSECYEDQAEETPDPTGLLKRVEDLGDDANKLPIVPFGAQVLLGSVDCQSNRLEVNICAHGPADEVWSLEKLVIPGNPFERECWDTLDTLLAREYTHASGAKLKIRMTAIDIGDGQRTEPVRKYIRQRTSYCLAVAGSNQPGAPVVSMTVNKKSRIRVYRIGTDTVKSAIYSRLKLENPGLGYIHFGSGHGHDSDHFKQLTSEACFLEVDRNGKELRRWRKAAGARNEALDLMVYNLALREIIPVSWTQEAKNILMSAGLEQLKGVDFMKAKNCTWKGCSEPGINVKTDRKGKAWGYFCDEHTQVIADALASGDAIKTLEAMACAHGGKARQAKPETKKESTQAQPDQTQEKPPQQPAKAQSLPSWMTSGSRRQTFSRHGGFRSGFKGSF